MCRRTSSPDSLGLDLAQPLNISWLNSPAVPLLLPTVHALSSVPASSYHFSCSSPFVPPAPSVISQLDRFFRCSAVTLVRIQARVTHTICCPKLLRAAAASKEPLLLSFHSENWNVSNRNVKTNSTDQDKRLNYL